MKVEISLDAVERDAIENEEQGTRFDDISIAWARIRQKLLAAIKEVEDE